jgi:hypothetical protein
MKLNTQFAYLGSGYLSSVELEERNAVLRQNLANWPLDFAGERSICGDNYLWERVHGRLHFYSVDAGNLILDAFDAPPNNTLYHVYVYVKHTDNTFKIISEDCYSSNNRIVEIDTFFVASGKTFKSAYLLIYRFLPDSPRPRVLATGEIYSTDNGQIVKGNFTVPR